MRKVAGITCSGICLVLGIGIGHAEQQGPPPTPLVEVMDYLARDGGSWTADNPAFTADDPASARSYRYVYEWSLGGWIVKNQILGVVGDRTVAYWESITWWDPVDKKVRLHQFGRGGAHATGHTVRKDDTHAETFLTFVMADGETWEFHEVETTRGPDEFESVSYRLRDGEWVEQQRLVWKRVRS